MQWTWLPCWSLSPFSFHSFGSWSLAFDQRNSFCVCSLGLVGCTYASLDGKGKAKGTLE